MAPITPLALRLLRAVMCHSTFATFLRSFPPHMSAAFNQLFGASSDEKAGLSSSSVALAASPQHLPSLAAVGSWMDHSVSGMSTPQRSSRVPQLSARPSTAPQAASAGVDASGQFSFPALLKAWSSLPAQGQSKLERQHQRFLLCGAQWMHQVVSPSSSSSSFAAVASVAPASVELDEKAEAADELKHAAQTSTFSSQPTPRGVGFLGVQLAAMTGMLHTECFDDALTLLIEVCINSCCFRSCSTMLLTFNSFVFCAVLANFK